MNRRPLLSLLEVYLLKYPDESEIVERYIAFVEDNPDCFERSLTIGHVTGSAFLLDSNCEHVLLTHHKKLDKWLQPGGHADGVTDVREVCLQEAEEESGLEAIDFVTPELFDVDIHLIPSRGSEHEHYHYDCRFLLKSAGSDAFVVSDESHDLKWVHLNQVLNYNDEASIERMVNKAQEKLA